MAEKLVEAGQDKDTNNSNKYIRKTILFKP